MRSALVPVVSFRLKYYDMGVAGWYVIIAYVSSVIVYFGIILFATTTLFSFITLPVEINASNVLWCG